MKLPSKLRYFNKKVLNRLTGKVARSGHGPFTIVQHTGRKSGQRYETVIIAIPSADGFVIALTYGTNVDWYKNVCAGGPTGILYHQRQYDICAVEALDTATGRAYFPGMESAILGLVGIQDFIKLKFCLT